MNEVDSYVHTILHNGLIVVGTERYGINAGEPLYAGNLGAMVCTKCRVPIPRDAYAIFTMPYFISENARCIPCAQRRWHQKFIDQLPGLH